MMITDSDSPNFQLDDRGHRHIPISFVVSDGNSLLELPLTADICGEELALNPTFVQTNFKAITHLVVRTKTPYLAII